MCFGVPVTAQQGPFSGQQGTLQQRPGGGIIPMFVPSSPPPSSPSVTASPTASIIGATRGRQRRTAGAASGRRGVFQTSGGELGLLTPAGTAKKTLLGV